MIELTVINANSKGSCGKPSQACCCSKPATDSQPLVSLSLPVITTESLPQQKSCCKKKEEAGAPGVSPSHHNSNESFFSKYLPLESIIRERLNLKKWLGVNDSTSRTLKELTMAITNFIPAIGLAKLLKPLHVSPYLVTPSALVSMHLLNQGNQKLDKLGLNTASGLAILAANQFMGLPRALVRPIMAFCVLVIETKWPLVNSLFKLKAKGKDEKIKMALQHSDKFIKKDDFMRLLRLEALINTIPKITKAYSKAIDNSSESMGIMGKVLTKLGSFVLEILGLSAGFIFGGKGIDLVLEKAGLTKNSSYLSTRASTIMVLSCCPAEGSAEAIAEASAVTAT